MAGTDRNALSTAAAETRQPETLTSMTAILDFIDPTTLPPRVQQTLREIGPSLASGRTLSEIAEERGRQKDWASSRVAEVREALIDAALVRIGEMDARLRARIEELRPGSTA